MPWNIRTAMSTDAGARAGLAAICLPTATPSGTTIRTRRIGETTLPSAARQDVNDRICAGIEHGYDASFKPSQSFLSDACRTTGERRMHRSSKQVNADDGRCEGQDNR